MSDASTLTRPVPRPIVGVARLHTPSGLFVPPASPDPNPLAGIVEAIDGKVDRAATFWFPANGIARLNVGHLTYRVSRRTGRIPALVGWWTLVLAVSSLVLLPASGFRLAPGGSLALVAARRDDAAVAQPTP